MALMTNKSLYAFSNDYIFLRVSSGMYRDESFNGIFYIEPMEAGIFLFLLFIYDIYVMIHLNLNPYKLVNVLLSASNPYTYKF